MKKIIDLITSQKDQDELINFLEDFEAKIFNPNLRLTEVITDEGPEKFRAELSAYFQDTIATNICEKILLASKELKKEIESVPKIILTVALDPSTTTIDIVRNTLKTTDDRPVIVEYQSDPTIIGGAVIESNGYIFEHSFRDYFEKRRDTFLHSYTSNK